MLSAELRAVIGIWSDYFINKGDQHIKFRINNKVVKVWIDKDIYCFFIEDHDFYIRAYGPDIVKYCRIIQKMLGD